jgi:hypothetical protein
VLQDCNRGATILTGSSARLLLLLLLLLLAALPMSFARLLLLLLLLLWPKATIASCSRCVTAAVTQETPG